MQSHRNVENDGNLMKLYETKVLPPRKKSQRKTVAEGGVIIKMLQYDDEPIMEMLENIYKCLFECNYIIQETFAIIKWCFFIHN